MSKVTLKEISELKDNIFFIDLYQRGYRWTKREVEAMLEDIAEFINTQSEGFYCLQPLTVNKNPTYLADPCWSLIDGQQRLTTIYLIYLYWYHQKEALPFQLVYPDRSEMKELVEELLKDSDLSLQNRQVLKWTQKDINCFYVWQSYQVIQNWFKSKSTEFITKFQNTLQRKVRVIWYDLAVPPSEENKVFYSMNSGRILLSNDELIKGLLLRRDISCIDDNFRAKIAFEWHLIESLLADDRLFACLVRKEEQSKYLARIGLIFDVLAKKYNKCEKLGVSEKIEQFSFDVFDQYLKKQHTSKEALTRIWKEVNAVAAAFKEWEKQPCIYNMIGFLVNRSVKNITEIWQNYNPANPEAFKKYLQQCICVKWTKSNQPLSRSRLQALIDEELKHNENNNLIHDMLLLYNISYLRQDGCFAFDRYQAETWNLEDINATADKELAFEKQDGEENPRRQWLKELLDLNITNTNFESLRKEIQAAINNKSYLQKDNPDFKLENNSLYLRVLQYFCSQKEEEWGNTLGNLTLLDETTNKHYHNDLFPCKREKILKRMQKGVFIPPCTLKVFMKSFAGAGETLLMWTDKDAEAYKKDMLETILTYLELADGIDEAAEGIL